MRGIELLAGNDVRRVYPGHLVIRLIIADEVRPAVIAGAARLVDFVVTARPTSDGVFIRVGTDVAPVQESGMRVDREPIGIAMPHRVDLGPCLRRSFRKEISVGDGVGAVGLGMDADDLPAQVVGVAGRFLRVPRYTARPLVERGVSAGEWIRVVAGGHEEIALAVEGDRAAGVTALQALSRYLEENLSRRQVE